MSETGSQKTMTPSWPSLFKWICFYPVLLRWGGFILITQIYFSCAPTIQSPQNTRFLELRIGQLDPQAGDAGTMVGISRGRRIDDRLWWQLEANYFRSSYTRATTVADEISGGQVITTEQVEVDFSNTILSIFIGFYYEYSLGGRFFYRGTGSLGWEHIVVSEKNYVENVARTRTFDTPGLQISAGLGIGISRSSMIFGDLIYNSAKAKSDYSAYGDGLPVYQEINVSGFGFRVGINFLNFKYF